MKKILFSVLALFLLTGVASAQPTISFESATYVDDGSVANLSSMEPRREVELIYRVTSESGKISYSTSLNTNYRNNTNEVSKSGFSITLHFALEMGGGEYGSITINADDGIGTSALKTDVRATTSSESRIEFAPASLNLKVGESDIITTQGIDGTTYEYIMLLILEGLRSEFTVDDPSIASIESDENGYITVHALKAGTTTVRATLYYENNAHIPSGDTATCVVTVNSQSNPEPSDPENGGSGGGGGGGCNANVGAFALGIALLRLRKTKKN